MTGKPHSWRLRVTAVVVTTLAGLLGPVTAAGAGTTDDALAAKATYLSLRAQLEKMTSAKGVPMPAPGQEMQFKRPGRGTALAYIECIGSVGDAVHRGAFGTFPPLGGIQVVSMIICTSEVSYLELALITGNRTLENPTVTYDWNSYVEATDGPRSSISVSTNLVPCHNWLFYSGIAGGRVTFPDGLVLTASGQSPNHVSYGECLS